MPIINKLPTTGSGGGDMGNKMNIFVQPTEPIVKEGFWVATDKPVPLDIVVVSDMSDLPSEHDYTKMLDIPYVFRYSSTSVVGTDIYLFGSIITGTQKYCYKYDTISNTYTKMLDIPYEFSFGSTSVVGTDIYLFGGNVVSVKKYCYKYDTILNTYTKMIDIPYEFSFGSTSVVGTDIYLFGGGVTATRKNCYKYDTILNTYTKMIDIPYAFYGGSTSVVGNDVYLFGGGDTATTYRYCYKYDTILNTYTKMLDIPYAFYSGSTSVVGNDVYLFGSYDTATQTNCYKYGKTITVFDNDTFVIIKSSEHDGLYKTQFYQLPSEVSMSGISRITSGFDDASLYIDNTDILSPMCYGDGEQWVKFKN